MTSPFYISNGSFTINFEAKVLHGLPVIVRAKILIEQDQEFKYTIDTWNIVQIAGRFRAKITTLGIPWVEKRIESNPVELSGLKDKILAYIEDLSDE